MSVLARVKAFLGTTPARRRLAAEALWALWGARIATLLPAVAYAPHLGRMDGEEPPVPEADRALAREIGHVVRIVARVLPFRAACLQQALAVRWMLARRGIAASLHLGVARSRAARARPEAGEAAHAWVSVAGEVVSGDGELDRYAVVARFA